MDPIQQLADEWLSSGIQTGDIVMLHSRANRVYRRFHALGNRIGANDLLQSFLRAVGPEGSLLFPAFRYDFAKGVPFDMRNSPSGMGALSEAARQACGRNRTGHPFYSFSCFGPVAAELAGLVNRDAFGEDSPFAVLYRRGGKIAVLDLDDQHSVTFYHYVEQRMNVSYRYKKQFTGRHVDLDGIERTLTFEMLVRDLDAGVVTHVNPMGERLWQQGLYHGDRPGEGTGLRTITSSDLFDATAAVIKSGQALGTLYRIEDGRGAVHE